MILVRDQGHLLSKEQLLADVWSDAAVEEGNLNRTISSIRKALGERRGESRFIETVPKRGYRFVASVVRSGSESGNHDVEGDQIPDSAGSRRTSRRFGYVVAAGVVLAALIFGTYIFIRLVPRASATDVRPAMVRLTNNEFDEDQAQWTRDNQIRFVRYVTKTRAESWVMNTDGSEQRRANDKIRKLLTGLWSPDGKYVIFVKEDEGPENVYFAQADGSFESKLPLSYPPNGWSPDGTRLVFAKLVDRSNAEIFVHDIASGTSTNISNHAAFDADPLFSPDGKQISFVSSRDGGKDAYVMDADGANVRRLTDHPAIDAFPSIAPDGTQVVFDSNREGENNDIYLKGLNDDLPAVKLTDLPSHEEHRGQAWSPDGTKMVITSDQGGRSNIYVIDVEAQIPKQFLARPNADILHPNFSPDGRRMVYQERSDEKGSKLRVRELDGGDDKILLTTDAANGKFGLTPVFSPDSRHIAFTDRIEGNTEVCLIEADGGTPANLTQDPSADSWPAFSPDGRSIFFQTNRDGAFERQHIFRMNLDGTDQLRVLSDEGYEFSPKPISDGRIVYSGDRDDGVPLSLDIRIADPGQNTDFVLAQRPLHDSQPALSPDGSRVAFVSQSDGNSEIYLIRIDGTGLLRLTRNVAEDLMPAFSADGRTLYFCSERGGRPAVYSLVLSE